MWMRILGENTPEIHNLIRESPENLGTKVGRTYTYLFQSTNISQISKGCHRVHILLRSSTVINMTFEMLTRWLRDSSENQWYTIFR